jgi:hypothetical protein
MYDYSMYDKKFMPAEIKKFTNDWSLEFPMMGIQKPRALACVIEPLVQRIYLERNGTNNSYDPEVHVCNMMHEYSGLGLELRYQIIGGIGRTAHNHLAYKKYAGKIKEAMPFPLEGDIYLNDVVNIYKRHIESKLNERLTCQCELQTIAMLHGWFGQVENIQISIAYAREIFDKSEQFRRWRDKNTDKFESWIREVEETALDRKKLQENYERKLAEEKLTKVPRRAILLSETDGKNVRQSATQGNSAPIRTDLAELSACGRRGTGRTQSVENGTVDANKFWEIIECAHEQAGMDADEICVHLADILSEYNLNDIILWQRIFEGYAELANRSKLRAAAFLLMDGCDDNDFDYFRGWLITRGKSVFLNAIRDPDTLADFIGAEIGEYDDIIGVAYSAYAKKTKAANDPENGFWERVGESFLSDELKAEMSAEIVCADDMDIEWHGFDEDLFPQILPRLYTGLGWAEGAE